MEVSITRLDFTADNYEILINQTKPPLSINKTYELYVFHLAG